MTRLGPRHVTSGIGWREQPRRLPGRWRDRVVLVHGHDEGDGPCDPQWCAVQPTRLARLTRWLTREGARHV